MKTTKNKLVYKKIFFILTIFGVLILVYSMFQPTIAMSPDINRIVVNNSEKPNLINFGDNSIKIGLNDPYDYDQVQSDASAGAYYIGYLGDNLGCYKQLIYNDRTPFIGFDIAIGKKGTPTEPLYIGVLKDGNDGYESPLDADNWHVVTSISPNFQMADNTLEWINADFSNNPYNKREVNIVLISDDDPTDGNYWMCGYAQGNSMFDSPYMDGNPNIIQDVPCRLIWKNSQGVPQWAIGGMNDVDFAFVTYTEGGSQPSPPVITITTSSWVTVSRTLGILSLLSGVVSGIKFRWF